MTPKVYFADFATRNYETLPKKLARLILTAGMDQMRQCDLNPFTADNTTVILTRQQIQDLDRSLTKM